MPQNHVDATPRTLIYLGKRFVCEEPSLPARAAFAFRVNADVSARESLLGLGMTPGTVARVFGQGRVLGPEGSLATSSSLASGQVVALVEAQEHPVPSVPNAPNAPGNVSVLNATGNVSTTSVLYEDDFLIAVDKPQDLLVHGDGSGAPTLTDAVQALLNARSASLAGAPVVRAQALQRLDMDTSGVVLFSKHLLFQPLFDALLAGDGSGTSTSRAGKLYVAVVRGVPASLLLEIDNPIGRDRHDARRMRVSPTGKPAFTQVELIARLTGRWAGCSLVAVRITTGRRHQIRVHLAAHGIPVVGDALYGTAVDQRLADDRRFTARNVTTARAARNAAPSLMLHALGEEFVHPLYGSTLSIRSAWPDRFPEPPVMPSSLMTSLHR